MENTVKNKYRINVIVFETVSKGINALNEIIINNAALIIPNILERLFFNDKNTNVTIGKIKQIIPELINKI